MENKGYVVKIDNESRIYPAGTRYEEIAKEFQPQYAHQIVLVYVNQYRLQELDKVLEQDCELRFVTTA